MLKDAETVYGFEGIMKRLRQEEGLTQRDFAELIQVNLHTINAWENGKFSMKVDSFFELLERLGYEFYICPEEETEEAENADSSGDPGVPDGPGSADLADCVASVGVHSVGEEGPRQEKCIVWHCASPATDGSYCSKHANDGWG